jgi:hypothetical protein
VVVRLWNNDKDADEYAAWLTAQGNPDAVVAELTYRKIHS